MPSVMPIVLCKVRTLFRLPAALVLQCEHEFSNELHEGNFDGEITNVMSLARPMEVKSNGVSPRNEALKLHCATGV